MSIEIKVPALPESITEATVGAWHKKAGDGVKRDENLVDLETDKVVLEVPAESEGVLKEVLVKEGDTVEAGAVLAILEPGEATGGGSDDDSDKPDDAAADDDDDDGKSEAAEKKKSSNADDEAPPASPAAQKLMAEHGLKAGDIDGSGKDGRITKADVQDAVSSKESGASQSSDKAAEKSRPAPAEAQEDLEKEDRAAISATQDERLEQRVPMSRIRQRIAERLLDVSQNTAMLTTFNEVDMKSVMQIRSTYKEKFEKDHEVRLGFMSFFVKAAVEALKRFPIVNASIDDGDVVYHGYYDIGLAVSSPRGLLVPVMRDADQMSYAEVEEKLGEFGQKARDGKLTMEELKGGTFTITNGGVFGSMLSTPILNPPQSAILGMHAINERPVVVDGEIVIRPIMQLALSYDHRLIDGRDAVLFLRTIKELIEDPARLLLQV